MCARACIVVQTKVSQFELPTVIDEEVLGFEVSMENFASVTVAQSSQKLEQEELHTNRHPIKYSISSIQYSIMHQRLHPRKHESALAMHVSHV